MIPVSTVVRVAVALALTVVTGLVLTALVPLALGNSSHVVSSGSMAPRVNPGDVVVTQPVTAAELRPGQVVLLRDTGVAGGLLLHRLVSVDADGRLVTRGDANQSEDSVHADPADLRGLAVLRVPWVGAPALWRANARYGVLTLAAVVLVAGAVFVSRGWAPSPAVDGPARGRHRRPGRGARAATRTAHRSTRVTTRPGPVEVPAPAPVQIHPASRSSAAAVLSMTEAVSSTAAGHSAGATVTTDEGEDHRAPSARGPLPPVPPPVRRPGHHRGAAGLPAGAGVHLAGDHGGRVDGGHVGGQPRR